MDEQIENRLSKLPTKMQGTVFRMMGSLYKQEEETMISFIEEARRSFKITREEFKIEQEMTSQKLEDERSTSAKSEKQRAGAISARHRQKAVNRPPSATSDLPATSRIALEEEVVRVLSARSARSARSVRQQPEGALTATDDPNMRVPTPTHLFDVVPPSNPNHMKKNDTLCDDDFKEERDEIMKRMSSEQNQLESVKERQSAMLRRKMDKMANKQQESEVKATEVMMEATRREELQQSAKLRQEQKMRERLEEKKKNPVEDRATPFIIDVLPK